MSREEFLNQITIEEMIAVMNTDLAKTSAKVTPITEEEICQIIKENIRPDLDWEFAWDRAVRRFGCCITDRRRPGWCKITISKPMASLNSYETVKDTVLHEIAHANVSGDGEEHGHDAVWKAEARRLGTSDSRCYDSQIVQRPPRRFVGTCPNCGYQFFRNKRRFGTYHTKCGSTLGKLVWKRNEAA